MPILDPLKSYHLTKQFSLKTTEITQRNLKKALEEIKTL